MSATLWRRSLLALLCVGFLFSLPTLNSRHQAEQSNNQTEALLDARSLADWQRVLGDKGQDLPVRLLESQISSLAFSELHLLDLLDTGAATALSEQEFALLLQGGGLLHTASPDFKEMTLFNLARWKDGEPGTYLIFSESDLARTVFEHLRITAGDEAQLVLDDKVLWVPQSGRQLRSQSLGFDRAAIKSAASQGFRIWLRPENTPGLTPEQIARLFESWSELPGVQGVVFGGGPNEALGYPDSLELTGQQLADKAWKVGYIEIPARAQQDGIETLVRAHPELATRVLAISPAHQAKLSPFRVLGMYSLGARERNIRLLYLRPFAVPGRPELDEEVMFQLKDEIANLSAASTFETMAGPSELLVALWGLVAGALALLILHSLGLKPSTWWFLILLAPVGVGFAANLLGRSILYRCLLALCISVGGPVLAFLELVYPDLAEPKQTGGLGKGLLNLLMVSLCSVASGLMVAALLSDTTFLLGLDRFRGVKLLTLGTPLLIVIVFAWKRYSVGAWLAALKTSIAVYQAALAGAVGVVLALLYLRSGNDAGATASETERTLRVVLDNVLGVRPRFKEFLLAHPALVCTSLVVQRTGFLPSLIFVLLAAIGQAGIVDTFAHIHTPLAVTLTRVFLGVAFGAIFALLAWFALRLIELSLTRVFGLTEKVSTVD